MRFAVLTFPGTWSDRDCQHVLRDVLNQDADLVWHTETDLSRYDAIVVPGGFSYGDYLRCGAIARFSPVMEAVKREAERGKLVFGSCNGFQILCEAGLLPGVLMRNDVHAVPMPGPAPAHRDGEHGLHEHDRQGERDLAANLARRR